MQPSAPLLAEIADRAAAMEEARRLPADLAARMAAEGLFRIAMPRALGGAELPPAGIVATIEAVAAADASAGWCVMIGATTNLSLAWLPTPVAAMVAASPDTITGGVFAPMGRAAHTPDGWRATGRWSWASGSANCSWLFGGCLLTADGKPVTLADGRPDTRMLLFPRDAVELIDTWQVAGLKGTGSGDMAVHDLLVPHDHTVALTAPPVAGGALYLFPVFGLLALGIAGVASGNARAALDLARQSLAARRPLGSARSAAERATVQAEIATAEARLTAARALLFETLHTAWDTAASVGEVSLETRARLRLAATHMVRTGADVARTAYDLGGGAALFLENPLQRRFRDAHAMTQHVMVQPATLELAGRVLMGLPTDSNML
jgi:alkylation response protein AidB-like acyl-CoA dehydrogenase